MSRIIPLLYGQAKQHSAAPEVGAHREDGNSLARCPVTGRPCQGDLAYLCDDYGCARKAGLSPRSVENLWSVSHQSEDRER
jgi:hypothetical protein